MDVVLVELRWIDPKRYGAALDDAERGLRAFAHHVAQLARQDELAAARHARRLDEQDVAANRGPGEPGRHTRHARAHGNFALKYRRTENRNKIVAVDPDRTGRALGNADCGVAQHFADLAFEPAHAGFARVVLDDLAERRLSDLDLPFLDAIGLHLASDQIARGDL